MRIVFVCTGNTCRSPMAAELFRAHAMDEPRLARIDLTVDSAGLAAVSGRPAASAATRVMAERGFSLESHSAHRFDDFFKGYDLILTMTEQHKAKLLLEYSETAANMYTLKEYGGMEGSLDIADPFGQDESVYRLCVEEIEAAVREAVRRIVRELPKEGGVSEKSEGER